MELENIISAETLYIPHSRDKTFTLVFFDMLLLFFTSHIVEIKPYYDDATGQYVFALHPT